MTLMRWHYRRDERGDVVWYTAVPLSAAITRSVHYSIHGVHYSIHVTAESRSSFPCGWGVKVNGVFVQTKPSTGKLGKFSKYHSQPHDMFFRTVRDAKSFCIRHYNRTLAGALDP